MAIDSTPALDYAYDYDQRLIGATQASGYAYTYDYDYRTRRVRITDTVASTTTALSFSGGTSVQEYLGGTLNVEYIRGSDMGGGIGGILYTLRSGTPSFTHYNARGDVVAKSDGGTLTYGATYEAFGTRFDEAGTNPDRQRANTKDEDPTGLLNEGFRYRDLEAGVFITRDPIGFKDGPNLYTYVHQNPWTHFDPEGLYSWDEWKGIGKANIANTGIMLKAMAVDFPKHIVQGVNQAFWHPIDTVKAIGNQFKDETVTLATNPRQAMANYVNAAKHVATDPRALGETAASILVPIGAAKFLPVIESSALRTSLRTGVERETTVASVRARHYTDTQGLAGIIADQAIEPARGGGVHVEVGPPFRSVRTAKAETGAKAQGAYVEFDAPKNAKTTNVGPRKTAVVPTDKPLPVRDKNPVFKTTPWWKFWQH